MRRLLIRPGGMGDCILAFPAMESLKSAYTEVWVPSDIVPLVRFADAVRSIASMGIDLLGLPGVDPPRTLIERLRAFDSIVSWYGANREEFRIAMRDLGLPFEFFPALPSPGVRVHASDFFLKQVGGGGSAIPRIGCPRVAKQNFAAIHPFSGSTRKNWPIERFRELSGRLALSGAMVAPDLRNNSTARCASKICMTWPAGSPRRACISATIPGSRIWRPRPAFR